MRKGVTVSYCLMVWSDGKSKGHIKGAGEYQEG